jgi:hypothetical protein
VPTRCQARKSSKSEYQEHQRLSFAIRAKDKAFERGIPNLRFTSNNIEASFVDPKGMGILETLITECEPVLRKYYNIL